MPTLILSDTHLGPGRDPRTGLYSPEEDFFADDAFAALLDHYTPTPPHSHTPTTLVLAGDTFNLWEIDPLDELHHMSLGHPVFFDALRRWLNQGHHLFIIPGNHDFRLAFPHVQTTLQNLLLPPVRATHSTSDISQESPSPTTPAAPAIMSIARNASPSLSIAGNASPSHPPGEIDFGHFYHAPSLRLYVEHGDRYCIPQRPGQPPTTYRRDYYFTSVLKSHLPVAAILPGAAAAVLLTPPSSQGGAEGGWALALLIAAAARQGQDIAQLDLPRAAEDIAPAVAKDLDPKRRLAATIIATRIPHGATFLSTRGK
jgi:hypothetical protein